jgi:hypothetical protein
METKLKPSKVHVRLQEVLLENCGPDKTINFEVLKWKIINMRIPKKMIYDLIKEMEDLGLGELVEKNVFKIKHEK